jgi:hypothetical protein
MTESIMDDERDRITGRLALAVAAVTGGSAMCLGAYLAFGGPFGTINDIGNAATGILSAWLAFRLRPWIESPARDIALAAAVVGGTVAVVGSALVVSRTTGFLLAGLVSSVGFAGIGAWLVVANRRASAAWPRRLRTVGVAAGLLMAMGIVTLPGIPLRLDDMATAPAWVWIGLTGWLGTFVVFPAWALWLGLVERRAAARAPATPVEEAASV